MFEGGGGRGVHQATASLRTSEERPLVERAREALAAGEVQEAERLYRNAVEQHPDDSVAALELSRLLKRDGRSGEAAAILTESSEALIQQARFADSIPLLEGLLELEASKTQQSIGLTRLGRVLLLEQRFEEARIRLEQALNLDNETAVASGSNEPILLDLASVLWELGELRSAEEVLTQLGTAGSPFAARQLGGLLLWQGRFVEAVQWLDQVAAGRLPDALPIDLRIDLARSLAGALEVIDGDPDQERVRPLRVSSAH